MAMLILFIVFIYMVMSAPTSSEDNEHDNSAKAKGTLAVILSILAAPFVIIFKSSKRK